MRILKTFWLSLLCGPAFGAVDYPALYKAISDVETGDNPKAVSSSGARTRLQFMPGTWSGYSKANIRRAKDPEVYRVFTAHVGAIRAEHALYHKFDCEILAIGHAWRLGISAVRTGKSSAEVLDYSERLRNLYQHYVHEQYHITW